MEKLTNPEAFAMEAAVILAAAYETFPTNFEWTTDPDTECYPTQQGADRSFIQRMTLQWLTDEGYLRNGDLGWVLSQQGLKALDSVPDQLAGKEPLGKRLIKAAGKEAPAAIIQLIPFIVSSFKG